MSEESGAVKNLPRQERKTLDKIKVELAGIYAVAHQLCRQGYLAIPVPSGHYPEVDLVAHDIERGRMTGIQVKTRDARPKRWHFAPSFIHPTVYVILNPIQFYVLDRKYVGRIARRARKERWIAIDEVEAPELKDNWSNIWA